MGELEALGLEALRLKCQDRRVPTNGRVRDLALRLYAELHPRLGAESSGDDNEVDDAVLNNPPPEIIRAEDDVEEEPPAAELENPEPENPEPENPVVENPDDTLPYEEEENGEDAGAVDENPPFPEEEPENPVVERVERREQHQEQQQPTASIADITNMVQAAVDASMANTVHGLMEEIKSNQEKEATTAAENVALRSEIHTLRKQARTRQTVTQAVPQPQPSPPQPVPKATKRRTATTTRTTTSPAPAPSTRTSAPHAGTSTNTGNGFDFGNMVPGGQSSVQGDGVSSPPFYPASANAFPLPALLKKDLLAIEKGEYVDFDKLKTKKAGERNREDGEDGFRVSMRVIRDEDGEETLGFKKTETNKIENFAEWLEVWNKFLAARLHYKPREHSKLLVYQQTITTLCRTHKFHAVYEFDKAVRKTMAAEDSYLPGSRTVFWHTQPEAMKNEHLFGQAKTPTFCYNCNKKGHIADNCSKPNLGRNRSGNSGNSGGGNSNWQQQQNYHPYQNQNPRRGNSRNNSQQRNHQQHEQFQQQIQMPSPYDYPPPMPVPPSNTGSGNQNGGNNRNTNSYCRSFNHNGHCFRGPTCHFRHQCNRCHRDDHGGINCMQNTSTGFRPRF